MLSASLYRQRERPAKRYGRRSVPPARKTAATRFDHIFDRRDLFAASVLHVVINVLTVFRTDGCISLTKRCGIPFGKVIGCFAKYTSKRDES